MAMMLMTIADIVMRRVFNQPFSFSYELTENFLAVVVFSSIAYASSTGRHISIDVLKEIFPALSHRTVETIIDIFSAGIFGVVAWRALLQGLHMINLGQVTGILRMPYYPFYFVVHHTDKLDA